MSVRFPVALVSFLLVSAIAAPAQAFFVDTMPIMTFPADTTDDEVVTQVPCPLCPQPAG